MDTTVMEYTAEDLIAHKLQRAGSLVAKPKFDREGVDLLGLLKVDDQSKFCRIQCKGRSVVNSPGHIEIRKDYVKEAFVVFLFVEDGQEEKTHLFAFFKDDIQTWNDNGNEYTLSINQRSFVDDFRHQIFSQETIEKIKAIIIKANVSEEWALVKPRPEIILKKTATGTVGVKIYDGISFTTGAECPGNPDDFDYDPFADVWSAK